MTVESSQLTRLVTGLPPLTHDGKAEPRVVWQVICKLFR